MTARGAANALTRTTAILAGIFFLTSIALALLAGYGGQRGDIFDGVGGTPQQQGGAAPGAELGESDLLNNLGELPGGNTAPAAPVGDAAPAPAAPAQAPAPAAPAAETPAAPAAPAQAPAADPAPAATGAPAQQP